MCVWICACSGQVGFVVQKLGGNTCPVYWVWARTTGWCLAVRKKSQESSPDQGRGTRSRLCGSGLKTLQKLNLRVCGKQGGVPFPEGHKGATCLDWSSSWLLSHCQWNILTLDRRQVETQSAECSGSLDGIVEERNWPSGVHSSFPCSLPFASLLWKHYPFYGIVHSHLCQVYKGTCRGKARRLHIWSFYRCADWVVFIQSQCIWAPCLQLNPDPKAQLCC